MQHSEPALPVLSIESIDAQFGKNHVLKNVSLRLMPGKVVALIGPNAAGKTTTLRTISGLKTPTRGKVILAGADITSLSVPNRVDRGLALVPEGRQVFPEFTVLENLLMGGYRRPDRDHLDAEFDYIFKIFPRLEERKKQKAGSMSGGEQQMLAIGRGLLSKPSCLLLDEPALGLAPIMIKEISIALRELASKGLTILLSEQNAAMALDCASWVYILDSGAITLEGSSEDLQKTETVRKLYLGR